MPEPTEPRPVSEQERNPAVDAEVRTILIADIRGYTTYTRERGDEAAAELAGRFAEIVGEVVAARAGRLVELRGDEALTVFSSSRQALRAAVELQARFAEAKLPRGVGIGLDAGEAVPVGDGYRGTALNLAARLCAHAGPGEILASDGVVHLAATVEGIRYVQPRTVRLKGFDAPVRAVGVVPDEGGMPEHRPTALQRLSARRTVLAAGLLGAALAAVVLFVLGSNRAPPGGPHASGAAPPPFDAPGVAFLDAETAQPVDERVPLRDPVEVEYVDGAFWVFDLRPTALHKIDPATHELLTSVPVSFSPGSWLVDGNTIWFTDYEEPILHKLDATAAREVDAYRLAEGAGLLGVAKGAGSLWVALRDSAAGLLRVDPASGEVLRRYPVFVSSIVATDGDVWAAGWGSGQIHHIDPATDRVTSNHPVAYPISSLALGGIYAWAANPERGEVYKLDAVQGVVDTFEVPGVWSLGSAGGHIWAAGEEDRILSRIDVVTGAQETFSVGRSVNDAAEGDGQVAIAMPRQMDDVLAGVSGEVLKVVTPVGAFEYTDPAIGRWFDNAIRQQVERATCARLLNYPDLAPDEGGDELVPEVAAALPDVSDDGLTYAFRIRPGFAFSPPSNEPLTAETFRYSIERALSPRMGPNAVGIGHMRDVEGAVAFNEGTAASITGLKVEGETLTITLVEPSDDFLERLALSYFCPVPIGTPALTNGVNSPPIARSGPYYLADYIGGVVMLLKRNPNYPGPRQATFDAIVWRELVEDEVAIEEVTRGQADMVLASRRLQAGGPIDRQWGPGSDAAEAGDQRYFRPDEGPAHFFSERIGCQMPMANAPGINLVALCLRDP